MIRDALKLAVSLLSLRIGVFIVMILWSVDKLLNSDHAAADRDTLSSLEEARRSAAHEVGEPARV